VSNVEDADIVDATARMQANQLAYEAAAQTLAQLSRLSLLDFLR
jgi:flagellin-like hook-associated protein FlgL